MQRAPCHPLAGTESCAYRGVSNACPHSRFFGVFVRVMFNDKHPAMLRPVYVTARALRIHCCLLFSPVHLLPSPCPRLSVPNDTEKAGRRETLLSLRAPCILPKQINVNISRSYLYRITRQRMNEQDFFFVLYPLLSLRFKNPTKIILLLCLFYSSIVVP